MEGLYGFAERHQCRLGLPIGHLQSYGVAGQEPSKNAADARHEGDALVPHGRRPVGDSNLEKAVPAIARAYTIQYGLPSSRPAANDTFGGREGFLDATRRLEAVNVGGKAVHAHAP